MDPRQRILVVDDTPTNIQILVEILRDDYAVSVATTGAKALALSLNDPPPDLILLDIMMEGMDGYEVCRQLKSDVRTAGIPVIFVTALNHEFNEAKGLDLGAVDYITKPVRPAIVKARVRNHLELKSYRDQLERKVEVQVENITQSHLSTIFALSKLVESRDDDTGHHLERTQIYCRMIAERLLELELFPETVDAKFVDTIYWASPLHDMGKVAIPDTVLSKPGKLSSGEFAIMKTHTEKGAETLKMVTQGYPDNDFLNMGLAIARWHHEWWDGSGYPDGLKGEEIPLSARIMALSDMYDALTSERCYKKAFSHEESLAIITSERGTHFDPVLMDIFLGIEKKIDEVRAQFER